MPRTLAEEERRKKKEEDTGESGQDFRAKTKVFSFLLRDTLRGSEGSCCFGCELSLSVLSLQYCFACLRTCEDCKDVYVVTRLRLGVLVRSWKEKNIRARSYHVAVAA